MPCSRIQHSASGESKTSDPSISRPQHSTTEPGEGPLTGTKHADGRVCQTYTQCILGVHVLVAQHVGGSCILGVYMLVPEITAFSVSLEANKPLHILLPLNGRTTMQ